MSRDPRQSTREEADAHSQRLVEAALWLERLSDETDVGTRASFESWLAASPLNMSAFENVSKVHLAASLAADETEILALRHQTVARVALNTRRTRGGGVLLRRGRPRRRSDRFFASGNNRFKAALAASMAVLLLGGMGIWLAGVGMPFRGMAALLTDTGIAVATYRTGVGEQATVELADGSQIVLNTASAVRVAYSDSERRLILERGQAFFTVAKDAGRPFTVEANGKTVTAFGTAFDVRIQKSSVHVVLLEGQVSVSPGENAWQKTVMLEPSDMLIADESAMSIVKPQNVASLTAWRDGLLIFQDDELRAAVEEVNRYSTTHIMLDDKTVGGLRISGTFRVGQTAAFVEALREMFSIQVVRRGEEEIVLAAE